MDQSIQTRTIPKFLASTAWLAENSSQPAIKLVDVRFPEIYADGHLPGALNLPLPALATTRDGVPEMLLDQAAFEARLGELGIQETDTVVLYDGMWGLPAARALWALERFGHEDVRILEGGFDRWKTEGRPLTTNSPAPSPTRYRATLSDQRVATHTWLREHLADPDVLIVDTRTPKEYAQGHVPGAVNWDWANALPADNASALRPAGELHTELESLGVTPEKEIVVYCRSGARSAHTYFTLRHLGYPKIRNYDGSWLAWSLKEVNRSE